MRNLPSWVDALRPQQVEAIQQVIAQFSTNDVVFLDAPTGTGKTLIAEVVRQDLNARAIYLCSSISLQEQFIRDFPYAALLKGRANYPTLDHPELFTPNKPGSSLSCSDCNKRKLDDHYECSWCNMVTRCPYESAKATALRSALVCSNSYYFLYEANYVGTTSGRQLVIVDEADTLEGVLLSFIQVVLTERRIKDFGVNYPTRKTVESSWIDWALETEYQLKTLLVKEAPKGFRSKLQDVRRVKRLNNLITDIGRLNHPQFGLKQGNWVYDGYKSNDIIFKPITVSPYAKDYLWRHGKKWLLMSATVISTQEMADSLGL